MTLGDTPGSEDRGTTTPGRRGKREKRKGGNEEVRFHTSRYRSRAVVTRRK
jgi:hypothetical protein